MEESEYTKIVFDSFDKNFPQGWIEDLNWDQASEDDSLNTGIKLIREFEICIFANYSKLILSADYFVHSTEKISCLDSAIVTDEIFFAENDKKNLLLKEFIQLCDEIRHYNLMLKYHINATENKFKTHVKGTIINALTDSFSGMAVLFKLVCNSCWLEYVFAYHEDYIRKVIVNTEHLKYLSSKYSGEIKTIIDATIDKLTIVLGKLSFFSENKELAYRFDLQEYRIALTSLSQYEQEDFRSYLQKYIDVNKITQEEIYNWQNDAHKQDSSLWKFIFLMRYYTKKTKSGQQIDHLLEEFERHNTESLQLDLNLVDRYSSSLARNYMYNSRFSFKCKNVHYSFEEMKKDLEEIETIQNDTLVFNYHPYQKAIEFIIEKLSEIVADIKDVKMAEEYLSFLKLCFVKFKNNVGWCKEHQPYYIQSRYKFSTITVRDIPVFCPSSFCRPLKFKEIDEKVIQFNNELSFLNYQVKHLPDRVEWQEAKARVERLERKNLETMSLFMTFTTFLVGMLAIFIGNKEDVSIFSKLEYTSVLGMVMMLFVCLGYFVVTDNIHKKRSWFFGFFAVVLIIAIIIAYCKSYFGG